ncbi:hypothetical protein PBI_DEWDROP_49 [Microbacterium phage Dewdrop]|nr:hypothetical protein PBI_LEAF_49 [Microbacterium phage Leaf]QGZ17418.1 hypothetical protein PBI_DEWDROP_49 [Microbacterium phage Dewdrop]
MVTTEEALEQGWQEPAPTFFGTDGEAVAFLGKCRFSPWQLVRRTVPPEFIVDPEFLRLLEETGQDFAGDPPMVPSGLRPRPMTYMYFPEYR